MDIFFDMRDYLVVFHFIQGILCNIVKYFDIELVSKSFPGTEQHCFEMKLDWNILFQI